MAPAPVSGMIWGVVIIQGSPGKLGPAQGEDSGTWHPDPRTPALHSCLLSAPSAWGWDVFASTAAVTVTKRRPRKDPGPPHQAQERRGHPQGPALAAAGSGELWGPLCSCPPGSDGPELVLTWPHVACAEAPPAPWPEKGEPALSVFWGPCCAPFVLPGGVVGAVCFGGVS